MREVKEWSLDRSGLIGSTFGAFFGGIIAGAVAGLFISGLLLKQDWPGAAVTIIIAGVVGGLLSAGITARGTVTKIEITPSEVVAHKGGREWRRWNRAETSARTHMTEFRRKTGQTAGYGCSLLFTEPTGGETQVDVGSLGRQAFNEMGNTLNPVAFKTGADVPAGAVPSLAYAVDHAKVSSNRWGSVVVQTIACALLSAFACWVAWMISHNTTSVFVTALVAVLVSAGLVWMNVTSIRGDIKEIPRSITVDSAGITVDGTLHEYASLSNIWLTPLSYDINDTFVTLVDSDQKRTPLRVARTGRWRESFPDYERFITHLMLATRERPDLLAWELV